MKILLNLRDLKKNKFDEISDKIRSGYSLKSMSATLTKELMVKNVWTCDQEKYVECMWEAINKNTKAIEVNRKAIEVNRKAIEVNRKAIVEVKDILINLVQRLEAKGVI